MPFKKEARIFLASYGTIIIVIGSFDRDLGPEGEGEKTRKRRKKKNSKQKMFYLPSSPFPSIFSFAFNLALGTMYASDHPTWMECWLDIFIFIFAKKCLFMEFWPKPALKFDPFSLQSSLN